QALARAGHGLGVRFRVVRPIAGTRRRADLVFARFRVVVCVDGCFWHGCPLHGKWPKANARWWRDKICANVERDRDTDAKMLSAGWLVLRYWEHEDAAVAATKIACGVSKRRS